MQSILFLCFIALAVARPQGYSYQQTFGSQQTSDPQTQPQTTYGSTYGSQQTSEAQTQPQTSYGSTYGSQQNTHSYSQNEAATQSVFKPNFAAENNGHFQPSFGIPAPQSSPTVSYLPPQNLFTPNSQYSQEQPFTAGQQQAFLEANQQNFAGPTVTKDIFVHVAPREYEQYQQPRNYPQPPPRKHYRIVFIKAPSPPPAAALQVQQAPVEEKTIIYVLTKKADPIDLKALQEAAKPTQIHKPEVYFIKYKTQEEAKQAQLSIQAEYDKLGGTSQVSDEGIAPVTSVIGAFDHKNSEQHPDIDLRSGFASNVSPVSNYLPPHQKRV